MSPVTRESSLSWCIGGIAAAVLLLTADYQIYDNNFYALPSAIGLLAGEHPYRDFFEWGVPLQVVLSAAAQVVFRNHLLGEFVLQWAFIVAGVVLAFRVSLRLSASPAASAAAFVPVLVNLGATPTYHYPKLFIYPAATLLAWAYLDRPGRRRAAALGAFAAIAFFFRHDHGVYVGISVLLAFAFAATLAEPPRRRRLLVRDIVACGTTCAALVLPWAILVATTEGLRPYVEARAYINSAWSVQQSVFLAVLDMNPVHALAPDAVIPATLDSVERWLARLPARENALMWLYQVTMLVTLLALFASCWELLRARFRSLPAPRRGVDLLLAALVAAVVERQLFREPSYFVMVAPLAAAFGARLLAGRPRSERVPGERLAGLRWRPAVRVAVGGALLGITTLAAASYTRESRLVHPISQMKNLGNTFERLWASPAVDGVLPGEDARAMGPEQWKTMDFGRKSNVILHYLHDCTAPGDRLFVSGQTPYQVNYYADRPMAGGHLYWHDGWRADPARRAQSLALLQQQSVPFAFATHNPVLEELRGYPEIEQYFRAHYLEIDGTLGRLLVDRRRRPTGTYGRLGLPCFA